MSDDVAAAVTMVYAMSPSSRLSSTPVTVTVCVVFQFTDVNVSDDGATVPSAVLLELRPIVTFAVGCAVSTTVNVAVPPVSVVLPLIADTVNPEASLSVFVTATSLGFTPL